MSGKKKGRREVEAVGAWATGSPPTLSGLDRLWLRKAKGVERKIPATLANAVRRWVIEGPVARGPDRANWTYAELADHHWKTHGVEPRR
jgi:hypothetical protein